MHQDHEEMKRLPQLHEFCCYNGRLTHIWKSHSPVRDGALMGGRVVVSVTKQGALIVAQVRSAPKADLDQNHRRAVRAIPGQLT